MKEYRMSLEDAIHYVKSKRTIVNPSPDMMDKLKVYERLLRLRERYNFLTLEHLLICCYFPALLEPTLCLSLEPTLCLSRELTPCLNCTPPNWRRTSVRPSFWKREPMVGEGGKAVFSVPPHHSMMIPSNLLPIPHPHHPPPLPPPLPPPSPLLVFSSLHNLLP